MQTAERGDLTGSATTDRAPAASGPHRRLIVALLWIAVLIYGAYVVAQLRQRAHSWDFSIYYTSALSLREGMDPYTLSLSPIAELTRAADTPTFLLCFEPLTLMRPNSAYAIWLSINLAALAASLWLLAAHRPTGLDLTWILALVALALLYRPMNDLLRLTQCQMIIVLLMVLMKRWMDAGHDAAAGMMLAITALLRAYPFVLRDGDTLGAIP